jgi:hypothetical protein
MFKKFCSDNSIKLVFPNTSTHAPYVERFNRTIQKLLYKYMTEYDTRTFVDRLPDIVRTYNNRNHRMISMTPAEAESSPEAALKINTLIAQREMKLGHRKPSLGADQVVRVSTQRSAFTRGYDQQAQSELFKVREVVGSPRYQIPLYNLQDYDETEPILGGFYRNEIKPVSRNIFRVERILDRYTSTDGETYLLVQWVGYNPTYNSWINERDLVRQ